MPRVCFKKMFDHQCDNYCDYAPLLQRHATPEASKDCCKYMDKRNCKIWNSDQPRANSLYNGTPTLNDLTRLSLVNHATCIWVSQSQAFGTPMSLVFTSKIQHAGPRIGWSTALGDTSTCDLVTATASGERRREKYPGNGQEVNMDQLRTGAFEK